MCELRKLHQAGPGRLRPRQGCCRTGFAWWAEQAGKSPLAGGQRLGGREGRASLSAVGVAGGSVLWDSWRLRGSTMRGDRFCK